MSGTSSCKKTRPHVLLTTSKQQTNWHLCKLLHLCTQVAEKASWVERRHRNRIAEIIGLVKNLKAEMDEVQTEDEEKL